MTTSFGKFRLLERIGGGRLSQVYRIGRIWGQEATPKVVLKRVAPELIGEPGFVQLVAREAGLLSRLDHESLCACEEMGVIDGCAFLTLDLVDGCTLRALLRRLSQMELRLPISAVLSLGAQAAQVLDYLHRHSPTPLVHLDLSPQNVMISREGQLKLIDFGIARFLDGHDPPPLDGRIAGTVGYMSPEQARGQADIQAQADQFGLGILLWEMLSGRRLYAGNTDETWKRMREGDTPSLAVGFPDVGPDLARVVDRLLEARPSDRYADLSVFCDELKLLTSNIESGRRPLAALTQRLMEETDFDPFDHVRRVGSRDLQDARSDRDSGESGDSGELGDSGEVGDSGALRHTEATSSMAAAASSHDIPTGEIPIDTYAELSIAVDHGEGTPSEQMRAIVPEITPEPRPRGEATMGGREALESPFLEPSTSFDVTVVTRRRRGRRRRGKKRSTSR